MNEENNNLNLQNNEEMTTLANPLETANPVNEGVNVETPVETPVVTLDANVALENPVVLDAPVENTTPVVETPVSETTPVFEQVITPSVDPVVETAPALEETPVENTTPVVETPVISEEVVAAPALEETVPAPDASPVESTPAVPETPVAPTVPTSNPGTEGDVKSEIAPELTKKSKKWLIFPIIIGVLVVALLVVYFVVLSPKNMVKGTINGIFTKIKEVASKVDTSETTELNSTVLDGEVSISFPMENKKQTFAADVYAGVDVKNNYMDLKLSLEMLGQKLDAEIFSDGKLGYLTSKALLEGHIIKVPLEEELNFNEMMGEEETAVSVDEYVYLLEVAKNTTIEKLDTKMMSKSISNRKVNEESFLSTKVDYILTEAKAYEIMAAVFNAFAADTKATDIFVKLGYTKDMLTQMGKTYAEMEADPESENVTITAYLTLFTNDLVALEMVGNGNTFMFETDNKIINVEFAADKTTLDFEYNIENNSIDMALTTPNAEGVMQKMTIGLGVTENKDDKNKAAMNLAFSMYVNDMENSTFDLNTSLDVTVNGNVDKLDVTKAVTIDQLPPETQQMLMGLLLGISED